VLKPQRIGAIISLIVTLIPSGAYAGGVSVPEMIACEASGESLAGQIAVGLVIRQRSINRRLTPEQVITQAWQFSCWDHKAKKLVRRLKQSEIQKAIQAWQAVEAMNESAREIASLIGKADHYYAQKLIAPPYWAKNPKRKAVIGGHTFLEI
jgi:spore germination cell wall hydrolase CwlJ-like protein